MPGSEQDAIEEAYQEKLKGFYDALFEAYLQTQARGAKTDPQADERFVKAVSVARQARDAAIKLLEKP